MKFPTELSNGKTNSGAEAIRQSLLDEIGKGVQVIARLDDITFRSTSNVSSIGEQFRHNLDFLDTFLTGLAIGRIDYSRRERDVRIANSREFAIARFRQVAGKVARLTRTQMGSMVSVRSEIEGADWLASSVIREMEFVLSHTIHHHALISEKLARHNVDLDVTLGVAPSTRNYWNRVAA